MLLRASILEFQSSSFFVEVFASTLLNCVVWCLSGTSRHLSYFPSFSDLKLLTSTGLEMVSRAVPSQGVAIFHFAPSRNLASKPNGLDAVARPFLLLRGKRSRRQMCRIGQRQSPSSLGPPRPKTWGPSIKDVSIRMRSGPKSQDSEGGCGAYFL